MTQHSAVVPLKEDNKKRKNKAMKRHQQSVTRLLEFLKVAGRLEPLPGFSHALFLNSERLTPEQFKIEGKRGHKRLRFRHTPPAEICFGSSRTVSLGTYLAVLDDVTTWALIAHGKRPGVSVNLNAQWGNGGGGRQGQPVRIQAGVPLDIITTVQKVGKNLGFVKAKVMQQDKQIVAFGGHVKFLRMGFFTDLLLKGGLPLLKLYSRVAGSEPIPQTYTLKELFDNLKFKSFHQATFTASAAHASHGGALHGGCQSILMELVGEQTAKDTLATHGVELDSINVTFLSKATPSVVIRAKVLKYSDCHVRTKVEILARTVEHPKGGRIISEGLLQWRISSDASSIARPLSGDFSVTAAGSCSDKGSLRCVEEETKEDGPHHIDTPLSSVYSDLRPRGHRARPVGRLIPVPSEYSMLPIPPSSFESTPGVPDKEDEVDSSSVTVPAGHHTLDFHVVKSADGDESVEWTGSFTAQGQNSVPVLPSSTTDISVGVPPSTTDVSVAWTAASLATSTSLLPPSLRPDDGDDANGWSPPNSSLTPSVSSGRYAFSVKAHSNLDSDSAAGSHGISSFAKEERSQRDTASSISSVPSSAKETRQLDDSEQHDNTNRRRRTSSPGLSSRGLSLRSLSTLGSGRLQQSNPPPPPPPENTTGNNLYNMTSSPSGSPRDNVKRQGSQVSLYGQFHLPFLGYNNKKNKPKASSPGLKSPKLKGSTRRFPSARKQLRIEDFDVSAIPTAQVTVLPIAAEASDTPRVY